MSHWDESKPNEVWQDKEGTLMTPAPTEGHWLAFGYSDGLPENSPFMTRFLPFSKVFEADGAIADGFEGLAYAPR